MPNKIQLRDNFCFQGVVTWTTLRTISATFNRWNDERNVNVNRNGNRWNRNYRFAGVSNDEMLPIIEKMSLEKSELKQKLEKEVARYVLFQTGVLKQETAEAKKQRSINIKTFAKYLLQHGTLTEKREVLSCIKSRILLKDKKLTME